MLYHIVVCVCVYVYVYVHVYTLYIYVYIYIYIYIYVYIHISYIHTHLVRHGNRQDVSFNGFRRRHHPTYFLWFPSLVCSYGIRRRRKRFLMVPSLVFMVSVVARNVCFNGFRRWLLWLPAATGPRLSLRWKP